jgi:hypothetical protein
MRSGLLASAATRLGGALNSLSARSAQQTKCRRRMCWGLNPTKEGGPPHKHARIVTSLYV